MDAILKIYDSQKDTKIKEQVIHALAQHAKRGDNDNAWKKLVAIAKSDEDVKAQEQAVFWIGQIKGRSSTDTLIEIYEHEGEFEPRRLTADDF